MLPVSANQQPHMPLHILNNENNTYSGSPGKRMLELLKISLNSGHSQPNALETDNPLYTLNGAQREDYINDLHNIYLSLALESSAGSEGTRVTLSNNMVFIVENNGDGMVLTIGEKIYFVDYINFVEIPIIIERFIFNNKNFFKGTDTYATVLKHYTERKHNELDIIINIHAQIEPLCYVISEYLRSGATDPHKFVLPPSLEYIAKRSLQIDFGCLISGEKDVIYIGDINVEQYKSSINKSSLFIRASEKMLKENADNLRVHIVNAYPQGCILQISGGVGHFSYYDVQKDILFSGGKAIKGQGMSGMGLRDYFAHRFNSANVHRKETLILTDHNAQEMLEVSNLIA
ncbi:hypothetical protein ACL2XO_03095 [Sodalis sp. RH15]|uniref:hypothetical protein n=1 Tax=Sodalis sp. RH15 TaxID=3394330 RepID=UPI0039B57015